MQITSLTTTEEHLMQVLWKLNSFHMKDVLEHHPEPKPHQNTVSTYLKILVEKGFLSTEKEGRIFKYTVSIPYDDYKKFILNDVFERFFCNSGNDVLEFLFERKLITQQDLMSYINLKIEMKTPDKAPIYAIANQIVKEKKKKKNKKNKKKK